MKNFVWLLTILLLLGAGCIQSQTSATTDPPSSTASETTLAVEIPTDAKTELWIIKQISSKQITYSPIEWFSGDKAVTEAQKDGCREGCTPNGFYWRYRNGIETLMTWTLAETSSIQVKLICNREDCQPDNPSLDGFQSMSYDKYLLADSSCRSTPLDCPYYSIGTEMDFFNIVFTQDGETILQIAELYVP